MSIERFMCPYCAKDIAKRQDGMFRTHRNGIKRPGERWSNHCEGSGRKP